MIYTTAAQAGIAAEYNQIRDGSYSAACQAGIDLNVVRALAGHRSPGQVDAYALRNLEQVRPATDAVYAAYFG